MILTDYLLPKRDTAWDFAAACGVKHGVVRLPDDPALLVSRDYWKSMCASFRDFGFQPLVVEPLPNCLHDHIKAGDAKRDECIDTLLRMFPLMQSEGVTTLCYNFMAHVGWTRTRSDYPERGGAKVTAFDEDAFVPVNARITENELWENYAYFMRAAVPEAEKYGIRLALHPDDPPLARMGDVSRIMISLQNIQRAINLVPSENSGVTFCQACYAMMGEDVEQAARAFGSKIFFIHFRNASGNKHHFHETFHDNGCIDMAKMISVYRDLGLNVPIRVDHVPQLANEDPGVPGYTAQGRLYAIGYLKGLLEMSEKD